VLIDSEGKDCPGNVALSISQAYSTIYGKCAQFDVVVKHRAIENWLIADPQAISLQKGRFKIAASFVKKVSPNKADAVNAAADLLSSIAIGREYHKRQDPKKITERQDPVRVAKNSRSFTKRKSSRLVEKQLGQSVLFSTRGK